MKKRLGELGLLTKGNKAELTKRLLDAGGDLEELGQGTADDQEEDGYGDDEQDAADAPTITPREVDLLRCEKELAEREVQLLRREMDMLRVSQRADSTDFNARQSGARLKDIKDMLGDFDGNARNFSFWEQQIRYLKYTCGLDDLDTKAIICSKLKGKAREWYHSRPDCVEMNAEDVLRELRKMFDLRPSKLQLRREFDRKWKVSETFADYLHDKVTLGNLVPIAEDELVDYLVEGIPNANLQSQARIQRFSNIAAFSRVNLKTA